MFPEVLWRFAGAPFKIQTAIVIPLFEIEQRIFSLMPSSGLNGDFDFGF